MSLSPFVPAPKFEDYREGFKTHFRLERRADGVLLAQAHTMGGSIRLSHRPPEKLRQDRAKTI
jgi:hypothetical protein